MRQEERQASPGVEPTRWSHRPDGKHWDDERVESYDAEPIDEEFLCGLGLSADALDAHRHVLEMASTIETLTRDFENQQQELLIAYKKLKKYTSREPQSPTDRSPSHVAKLHQCDCGNDGEYQGASGCCSHQEELHELRKVRCFDFT